VLEPISNVAEIVALDGDEVLYEAESFVTRRPISRSVAPVHLGRRHWRCPRLSASVTSTSRAEGHFEGRHPHPTQHHPRKGLALDGQNPTLLYGYGGYSISEDSGVLGDATHLARNRAAFSSSPTFAVAASSARNGTGLAS